MGQKSAATFGNRTRDPRIHDRDARQHASEKIHIFFVTPNTGLVKLYNKPSHTIAQWYRGCSMFVGSQVQIKVKSNTLCITNQYTSISIGSRPVGELILLVLTCRLRSSSLMYVHPHSCTFILTHARASFSNRPTLIHRVKGWSNCDRRRKQLVICW